jgi:excisionase family DNA binding protein
VKTPITAIDQLPLACTVGDLCRVLDISSNTAYELIRTGQVRALKVGRQLRIPRTVIAQMLEAAGEAPGEERQVG